MKLHSLHLSNFRNWETLHLDLSGKNILIGPNAQGKSNILEAIYLLSTGKSFRQARDTEMVHFDSTAASVSGCVIHETVKRELRITLQKRGRKSAFVDGKRLRRITDLLSYFQVVIFSPENIALVQGSPEHRRNYLDIQIARRDPMYMETLVNYGRICSQRKAVLKEERENRISLDRLDPWTDQLVRAGTSIVQRRLEILPDLERVAREVHRDVTGGVENLGMSYESSLTLPPDPDGETIRKTMEYKLSELHSAELATCRNLVGPHRDDLKLMLNELDVRRFGSQGQKRSVAVGLKVTEVRLLWQSTGYPPLLLMDDVFSELDVIRSQGIFDLLSREPQLFLTTTNAEKIPGNLGTEAAIFHIADGKVVKK